MILPLHILIALASICIAIFTYFYPTKRHMNISYILVALTVVSGTYLVIAMNVSLVHSCTAGLIYLGIVFAAITLAKRKMITNI